jgi:hypothetical protein
MRAARARAPEGWLRPVIEDVRRFRGGCGVFQGATPCVGGSYSGEV